MQEPHSRCGSTTAKYKILNVRGLRKSTVDFRMKPQTLDALDLTLTKCSAKDSAGENMTPRSTVSMALQRDFSSFNV